MSSVTADPVRATRWAPRALTLRLAGVLYPISWVLGLLVFSASTQVRSTGAAVLGAYAGHAGAVTTQFLLTEGLPGIILGLVTWQLGHMASGSTRAVLTIGGLLAATVSIVQCGIGLWITAHLTGADIGRIGALSQVLNRMDGVKMLLLAVVAVTTALAVRRREIGLPGWLGWLALATAAAIAVSGLGYLLLDDALAAAAWISLPLLLCFVVAAAFGSSVERPVSRPGRGMDL